MFSASTARMAAVSGLAALVLVSSAAEAGVVVASSGPSAGTYPVGRKLGDAERIVLRAGDTLTVLDGQGTRVLRGAGTYTLGQKAGATRSGAFAVLTRQRSATRMRTGAVRNGDTGGPVTRPNLWYVDLAAPGAVCVPSADEVRVWRATSEGAASYSLTPAAGGATAKVTFDDGDMLSTWDRALPVTDGARFTIAAPDGATSEVTFRVIGDAPEEPEALAEKLIANGCSAQLDLLSSATLLPEG